MKKVLLKAFRLRLLIIIISIAVFVTAIMIANQKQILAITTVLFILVELFFLQKDMKNVNTLMVNKKIIEDKPAVSNFYRLIAVLFIAFPYIILIRYIFNNPQSILVASFTFVSAFTLLIMMLIDDEGNQMTYLGYKKKELTLYFEVVHKIMMKYHKLPPDDLKLIYFVRLFIKQHSPIILFVREGTTEEEIKKYVISYIENEAKEDLQEEEKRKVEEAKKEEDIQSYLDLIN